MISPVRVSIRPSVRNRLKNGIVITTCGMDWVVSTPGRSGYYEANSDRTWLNFQLFERFPNDFLNPDNHLVDVTGDGLPDCLLVGTQTVRVYPNNRQQGFGSPIEQVRQSSLPASLRDTPTTLITFADLLGDGKQHLVRISYNKVECWPNLGYGHFGDSILLANPPQFEPEQFRSDRLFLADLDGSGTADLIYIYQDKAVIYLNQSGNRFGDAIEIQLPDTFDQLDRISFVDVYGNGASCLIFSQTHPTPRHWCYDFTQQQKPYLLNRIYNNLGAQTTFYYRSSTHFYLEAKKQGKPWITNLPFPVQVLERIEYEDFISKSTLVSQFCYHHGYYDGVEREFRGFGLVERQDAEISTDAQGQDPHYVAPALSKTWYHTGSEHQDTLTRQYEQEYYQDDSQAALLPDSTVDWGQGSSDAEAMREAQRALKGSILRTEVYGLDKSESKQPPYSVVETNYYVQLLQPKQNNRYAVFYLHPRETLTYDYERNPNDPRFSQDVILRVDEYSHVLQSCHIAYGRRQDAKADELLQLNADEQQKLKAVCTIARYINQADDKIHLLGIPKENQTYEIKNLPAPDSQEILSFDQLTALLSASDPNAGSPFSKDAQVELINWQRHFYTSPAQNDPLNFGEVTPQVLPSYTEVAVFSSQQIQQAPNELQAQMEPGKYQNHDGHWWNPNLQETYYDISQFCLPKATKDPFGNQTTYEYDSHYLILVKTTDALNNQVLALDLNYEVLQPQKIIDINGNSSEVRFDPMGRVIVTSHYGTENDQPVGFDCLSNYNPQQATSVDDIMNDPQKYLQKAADYFYYDLFRWMGKIEQNDFSQLSLSDENLQKLWDELIDKSYINRQGEICQTVRELSDANQLQLSDAFVQQKTDIFNLLKQAPQCQPVRAIQLIAENYPQAVNKPVQIHITYSDGFGRILQQKAKVEPGDAFIVNSQGQLQNNAQQEHTNNRWLTSGRKIYNNKGNPVKQYEPYFINTPDFIDNATLNSFGVTPILYYDPLQRVTHIETAKGFLIKTEWTPWSETHYDENDTIKDSPYYQANISKPDSSSPYYDATSTPEEKQALIGKVIQFHNTPDCKILDNLGRTIRDIQQKEDGTQLITYYEWDIQGHLLSSADPRLSANGIKNFKYTYGLTGRRLKTESVDAGIRWSLSDVMGRPIYGQDGRETQVFLDYDQIHRPITIRVQLQGGSPKTVERIIYDESLDEQASKDANLRGQVYQHYDQAGLLQIDSYSILGRPLSLSQRFTKDYRNTVDWLGNSPNWNSLLQEKSYQYHYQYDGLGRVSQQTDPDGNVHTPEYHLSGLLNKVSIAPSKGQAPVEYVKAIKYNARGQRLQVDYGNQTSTEYTYDSKTFRLGQILTQTRAFRTLQNLNYTFDPVGNVAHIKDNASAAVLGDKSGGSWDCDYTYDALYQLTIATGRESAFSSNQTLSLPLSGNQRLRDYTRTFKYDASGNLYQVQHQQKSSRLIGSLLMSVKRLVKWYDTANDTTMIVSARSNRAVSSQLTAKPKEVERFFDANGNQIQTENFNLIRWNYHNNIQKVTLTGQLVSEFYVYNSTGHRVRKVTEHYTQENKIESVEETLYLGDLEIRRRFQGQLGGDGSNGGSLTGEEDGNGSNGGSLPGGGDGNGSLGEALSDFPWRRWLLWSGLLAVALNLWTSNSYPNFPWVLWLLLSGLLGLTFGLVSRFAPQQQNNVSSIKPDIDVLPVFEMTEENLLEESHFLRIKDDQRCIATLIYKPKEVSLNAQVRYTLDNHLGSYLLEVDSTGDVLSYEEYYPYGGTALVAGSNLELKHYRYSGKERDTNTGLYYYGVRYYAPELRRWLSTDPAGTVDGLNLYGFVRGNPVLLVDPNGNMGKRKSSSSGLTVASSSTSSGGPTAKKLRNTYSIGQHGYKKKEQKRLTDKYNFKVDGKTHESEHPIGFEPLNQTSNLKRGTPGRAGDLENEAPAYQEVKPLHRDHIGTGTRNTRDPSGFTSTEYRDTQRSLIESGDVSSAVQINQLGYAFNPAFQQGINTPERRAATDSYQTMVKNMNSVTYAQDSQDLKVPVDLLQHQEMLLARKAALTGEWPSTFAVNQAKMEAQAPTLLAGQQKRQKNFTSFPL